MADLRVTTWNVHRRHECLEEALAHDIMDVLAAQEVPTGRRNKDYPGHQNLWKLWGGGKAALYNSKK